MFVFKRIIFLFYLTLSLASIAQVKTPINLTITQERLQRIKDVYDLVTDLPLDCKIIRFDLTFKSNGRVLSLSDIYADTLQKTNYWRTAIIRAEPDSKIFLDIRRTDCKIIVGRVYTIKVLKNE